MLEFIAETKQSCHLQSFDTIRTPLHGFQLKDYFLFIFLGSGHEVGQLGIASASPVT